MSGNDFPTLEGFDPLSEDFLSDPVPMITRAHKECPVFFYPGLNMWVITRYDDICKAARDYRRFSSKALGMVPPPSHLKDKVPDNFVDEFFVSIDPPEHTASRKAVSRFFSQKEMLKQEQSIREIADRLIDSFIDGETCDIMEDYSYPLSLQVILNLLGLPLDNAADHRQWTEDLFSVFTPKSKDAVTKPMSEEEKEERWRRIIQASEFFDELVKERENNPKDDLLTQLIHAKDEEGKPAINRTRIIRHISELVAAGNDTTANLIGHSLLFFNDNPGELKRLKSDMSLLDNTVEEMLRRRGSSPGLFRITTEDVEIGGTCIPKDSLVWLLFIGGGLDSSHFSDPEKFDICRSNAKEHTAFGYGRHKCLGQYLARLEAKIGIERLITRIPDIKVIPNQKLEYLPVMTVLTLKHLQVTLKVR